MNDGPILDQLVRRMIALAIIGCALIVGFTHDGNHSFAEEQLTSGSSSKRFRTQTIKSIPFHLLNQATQRKISGILEKPSVYRRLPITAINADPDYFRFLTRYPEVIVNIWQLMGITNMTTERTGPFTISTNDGAGTISNLELVYGDQNLHIFYGTGTYEGPILKRKLSGKAVLVLKTENRRASNGSPITTSQLDVFLKIENATAGLVAKTIQPLVGTTADHNFVQSLKFVQRLNETTRKNGPGVQQMGKKLNITPDVRQKFNVVVNLVFQRAVNDSVPNDERMSVTPASLETRYSAPVQPQQNFNGQSTPRQNYPLPPRRGPAFENLRDSGVNYQQRRLSQPVAPAFHASIYGQPRVANQNLPQLQTENVPRLPARGHQAPRYIAQASWISEYGYQTEVQTIPARFDRYGQKDEPIEWKLR